VVANIAKDLGILTVAIVTKPFKFEGRRRIEQAERGIEQLRQYVDALVIVPNDRLQSIATNKLSLEAAFEIADNTLRDGIRGISDLITKTGVVNVDFADVRSILAGAGEAIMSIGSGTGENRMQHALQAAKHSMLLDVELTGANRVLINITSGPDITMSEIQEAVEDIEAIIDEEANIIWGSVIDPAFPEGKVQITLVATGTRVPRRDMRVNDARKRVRDEQIETNHSKWSQSAPERPTLERPTLERPAPERPAPERPTLDRSTLDRSRDTGYSRSPQSPAYDGRISRGQPRDVVDEGDADSPLQSSPRVGAKIQRPYEGRSDISIPPRMRGNTDRNT
jgi:cell division GTPase FtsZ